jgi:YgiT-type zinc finger domain-containing protein
MGQRLFESPIMICLICRQAETADGFAIVAFERGEFRLIVTEVPTRVCPSCGEAYMEESTTNQLLGFAGQRLEAGELDLQHKFGAIQI